jgi:MtN3 and saliva related transmembrane protein
MSLILLTGVVAGVLTTVAFLPQVIRTWRTRSTGDISLVMFVTYVTGIALWLVYGLMIRDVPLIASNAVTLVLSGTILLLKLRHG